jgi:hypothetical protein
MNKKISLIMISAIAAILTTSILTVALSYQAFAQGTGGQGGVGQILAGHGLTDAVTQANVKVLGQELTQGIKTQTGQECCKLLIHPFNVRPR